MLVLVGKGICEELAKRGQNIVLVGRTLSKLRTVAEELEQKYKVKTKVIDIDFSSERHVQQRVEADTQVCNDEDFTALFYIIHLLLRASTSAYLLTMLG